MATETLTYPTPMELREIDQELLPALIQDDPIFDEFPITEANVPRLRWVQRDKYSGLQQIRGLNGAPRSVRMPGANLYDMAPGYFGEFVHIDEAEITERRMLASWDQPVSIDDLVGQGNELLLQREIDRIRWIIWTLVTTGTFAVPDAAGVIKMTDRFPLLTLTAGIPWSTLATAVPTTNIRAAQQLSVGQSVSFGADAEIWVNQVTANNLLSNQNANDLFGRRINGGSTVNVMGEVNDILVGNNLPKIRVYDRFYIDETGTAVKFIPNSVAVLIGKRVNGAKLGEYRMTRNPSEPNMRPGAYAWVDDNVSRGQSPRAIHVHRSHAGGPVVFYPGAIVVMSV